MVNELRLNAHAPTPKEAGQIRTKSGICFDAVGLLWSYVDGVSKVSLDFKKIKGLISDEMFDAFRNVITWYIENHSPRSASNVFERFQAMVISIAPNDTVKKTEIRAIDLINYKAKLNKSNISYFATLRSFIAKWYDLGYSGISEDAVIFADELRVKNNPRGVAVMTMDTNIGPFTPIEQNAIQDAVHAAHSDGTLDDASYHVVLLLIYFGARPAQLAALKACDLVIAKSKQGDLAYILNVPRAKQKTATPRSLLTPRSLTHQAGDLLAIYQQRVVREYEALLPDPKNVPLFPNPDIETGERGDFKFHHSATSLTDMLSRALRRLKVISERTGKPMNLSPIRFRRTFGTNAAREGHGEFVIAEMMDHSDIQSAGIYIAAVPEIVSRIDKAIAMDLAPLAQAFKGKLIDGESKATRGDDPKSRIVDLRVDRSGKPVGSCGQHSFCGFSAPVACYTCRNFEPWLDGPHEAVLQHLIDKRARLLETTDQRIAEVNDRQILAVAQVVQLCRDQLSGNASNMLEGPANG